MDIRTSLPVPVAAATSSQSDRVDVRPGRSVILGLLGILYLLIVVWGLMSEGTWDDDCPTRYYNVANALENPIQFVSLYNRPLFTLLYFLPIQLGREAVVFQTALFAVLACYFIYLAARSLGIRNAFLAIPFTAFQAFYFPVAFNALTEPLASLIIAMSVYFLSQKRYTPFVICGALLPLIRLELCLLLVLWASVLIHRGHWKKIPVLALPLLAWNFCGALLDNFDWMWLANQVFKNEENRYGHGTFWQYFHRYIYLTGPIIFYFFFIGVVKRAVDRKFDFLFAVFWVSFLTYVVFSWKLSIGNAAGFMRNLIPLSPLAALFALEGFNCWIQVPRSRKEAIFVLVSSAGLIALTVLFFSRKLLIHHIVGDEPEYVKLAFILLLSLIYAYRVFFSNQGKAVPTTAIALITMTVQLTVAYTLISEPPIRLSPERDAMRQIAEWYAENEYQNRETYVNHIWFFYLNDYDYHDQKFLRVTKENLASAKEGALVVWENHYSRRLAGDVPLTYFQKRPEFREKAAIVTPDNRFAAVVFELETPDNQNQ
jgi:hypothetical protein